MSLGALLAAGAAVAGVLAAATVLAAADHGLGQLLAAVGPDGPAGRVLAALRSGREATGAERRQLVLVVGLALLAGGWLLAGPILGLALAAGAPALGARALRSARRRRRERCAQAAPAVARAIADALAGGHSVRGALAEAARGGVSGPAAADLRAAAHELAMGERTDAVLERWRRRAGHPACDAVAAAIGLQREAGGDLAGLLRGLAAALEGQVRAEADARGLTAQARFTALIVAVLPLAGALLTELASPGYTADLVRRPVSAILVATSLALQLAAWVAVRRISRLGT